MAINIQIIAGYSIQIKVNFSVSKNKMDNSSIDNTY